MPKVVLNLPPTPCTAGMIATAIPAAIRPYSMAVAPDSSLKNVKMSDFIAIGILIVVVVGAICFWAIEKFATDARLAKLLKLLVILVCLGAIVQRLMVLTY